MLIFFWTVYGFVAAVVLYRALPPLQLELLMLLGRDRSRARWGQSGAFMARAIVNDVGYERA